MGLFGDILGGVTSLVGGNSAAKASKKASAAEVAAIQQGISGINSNLATTQAAYSPYQVAGTSALSQEQALLGLTGNTTDWAAYVNGNPDALADYQKYKDQMSIQDYGQQHYINDGSRRDLSAYTTNTGQQSAINGLQSSPLFTSQYNQGLDAILQSASATGGLRGGNTQNSLANFGSSLLSNVIQQQLSNLNGISSQGLSATNGAASAGSNAANSVAGLLTQQGTAQANGITGAALAQNTGLAGAVKGFSGAFDRSGLGSILSNAIGGGIKF